MTLLLVTGPAEEPVTLEEARAHLRLDATAEDGLLAALITAARGALEGQTSRAFVTQSWRLVLNQWPGAEVTLPLAPVSAVTAVTLHDADGDRSVASSSYEVSLDGDAPCLASVAGWPAPTRRIGGVSIDFIAGYGAAAAVPQPLKLAILLLATHWFENREPVSLGETGRELPLGVASLVAPYRRVHL
ncbi:MAG: head-tail connector protein [Parvibaculum sp.]